MSWERNRYYTRSTKVNGRVVREYVGGGIVGEAAAYIDARIREKRRAVRAARQRELDELAEVDAIVDRLSRGIDELTTACCVASGWHRHDRAWRRRRA
jgi:hypothetical protein